MRGRNGAIVKRFDGTSRCFFLKRIQYNLESRRTVYDGQTESFPACTARSNQIRLACTPGKQDIRLWQRVLYCLLYQVPIGQPVRGPPPPPLLQTHQLLYTTVVPPPCAARNASRPRILPCPHVTLMLVADGVALALEHGVSVCFPIPYQ